MTRTIGIYRCTEKVNFFGRRDIYGRRRCGYVFEGMLPSDVRAATGIPTSCPLCGGTPSLVSTKEVPD